MSVIDQRILIIAPVEAVWPYISDPTLISKWNRACKQISVLSTRPTGVNARRRCVGDNGKTVVEEITAWLEHLGYEYMVVDGPFQSYRGRFRLQAVPEGTVVNWTIEYRLRGPMSGIRNLASFRHSEDNMMSDSLRQLRKIVEASGVRLDPSQHARFAMQAAPSVEERAALAPISAVEQPVAENSGTFRPVPIDDDDVPDLPLNPVAARLVISAQLGRTAYPEADPVADEDDTKPRPPQNLHAAIAQEKSDDDAKIGSQSANTVPISLVAPPLEPDPDTQTMNLVPPAAPAAKRFPPPAPDTLPERIPTAPMPAIQAADLIENAPSGDKKDTREVSIWDVFGVERPSEKSIADLEAAIASLQPKSNRDDQPAAEHSAATEAEADAVNTGAGPHIRALHRRKMYVKASILVRRPPGR